MKLLRDGWALILTVITLVVVPHDSWAFWFSELEDSWYGETWVEGDSGVFVIAKNATEEPVLIHELAKEEVQLIASMRFKPRRSNSGHSDALEIPTNSYQIIRYDKALEELPDSRKLKKSGSILQVARLQVSTSAEQDLSTIYTLLAAFGIAALAFVIGLFASQAVPLLDDETPERN